MNWHGRSLADIQDELQTDIHSGLTTPEVNIRRARIGLNQIKPEKEEGWFFIFVRQFKSPLIFILFGASVIVFFTGEEVDAFIILFVLLFNAIVGTTQEGKAQNTLRALRNFSRTYATVLRDSKEIIIPDADIVPGDIIIIREGEKIPADARIFYSQNLRINEAALTGESFPVDKSSALLKNTEIPTAEQSNMVFQGTHAVYGLGRGIVVATGMQSILGMISKTIAAIDTDIPLKTDIKNLSRLILFVVAGISIIIFILGVMAGKPFSQIFATVVSLAVSIIPEGLPIVLTLVLVRGVWRMAKQNALVKKLQAVESLGQARVIAVDKTGTLTKNELVVRVLFTAGEFFEITGSGYESKGEIYRMLHGKKETTLLNPLNHQEIIQAGKIASFCANARVIFSEESKMWQVSGDPIEAALLVFGQKIGFQKDELEREMPLLKEIPFDYRKKYHATFHAVDGKQYITLVGAPEILLSLCAKVSVKNSQGELIHTPLTNEKKKEMEDTLHSLFRKGFRTIGFAFQEITSKDAYDAIPKDLVLGGFFAMEDSLRPEARNAVLRAQNAGVRVIMITGDHAITAIAVAKEAGIFKEGDRVLTGDELQKLTPHELDGFLNIVTVFARIAPEDKMKIISSYRRRGEIIAMTGDGVNDAPSLVAADLGVAMGKIGTEVAREASDIVLLDDNFGSIVSAIEEGRSIYKTIKKVILYLFSTSVGEAATIIGALVMKFPLPILAPQILWLNLVTDGFLDMALAMEPKEAGLLEKSFERPKKYLVDALMVKRIIIMALPMMIGTLLLFSSIYPEDIARGWTVSLVTLAIFQWFNAFNCRSETISIFRMNPFSNPYLVGALGIVIVLQLLAVYAPFMQVILRTVPLVFSDWLLACGIASSIIFFEEMRKLIFRLNSKTK